MTVTFETGQQYKGHNVLPLFVRNNPPASGQYNGACPPGALVLDMTAGVIYQNTGTINATTWAAWGSTLPSPLTLPAVVIASALSTTDPVSTGALWVNSNVVTVSTGS